MADDKNGAIEMSVTDNSVSAEMNPKRVLFKPERIDVAELDKLVKLYQSGLLDPSTDPVMFAEIYARIFQLDQDHVSVVGSERNSCKHNVVCCLLVVFIMLATAVIITLAFRYKQGLL